MEPALDSDNLESVLVYCAYLQNAYHLQHRALHRFEWFVDVLIFGVHALHEPGKDERSKEIYEALKKEYVEMQAKYEPIFKEEVARLGYDRALLAYARAFLQYCRDEDVDAEVSDGQNC